MGTEIRTALLTSIASVPLQGKQAARFVAPKVTAVFFLFIVVYKADVMVTLS